MLERHMAALRLEMLFECVEICEPPRLEDNELAQDHDLRDILDPLAKKKLQRQLDEDIVQRY
jgi:hypothetical protein